MQTQKEWKNSSNGNRWSRFLILFGSIL